MTVLTNNRMHAQTQNLLQKSIISSHFHLFVDGDKIESNSSKIEWWCVFCVWHFERTYVFTVQKGNFKEKSKNFSPNLSCSSYGGCLLFGEFAWNWTMCVYWNRLKLELKKMCKSQIGSCIAVSCDKCFSKEFQRTKKIVRKQQGTHTQQPTKWSKLKQVLVLSCHKSTKAPFGWQIPIIIFHAMTISFAVCGRELNAIFRFWKNGTKACQVSSIFSRRNLQIKWNRIKVFWQVFFLLCFAWWRQCQAYAWI